MPLPGTLPTNVKMSRQPLGNLKKESSEQIKKNTDHTTGNKLRRFIPQEAALRESGNKGVWVTVREGEISG